MGLWSKIFKQTKPSSFAQEHSVPAMGKETFLAKLASLESIRRQKADEAYALIEKEFPRKMEKLGQEAAESWCREIIEKANRETYITVRSDEMHYLDERFFRITKSSHQAASLSQEGHPYIRTVPGEISNDIYGTYGLCFTSGKDIILYLGYGDELAEINFEQQALLSAGISSEPIVVTNHQTQEYNAKNLLIKSKESLKFPETLKTAIRLSSNDSLRSAIGSQDALHFEKRFTNFGFKETAAAWNNVVECARSFPVLNDAACEFIRENIDQIIPELTIDDIITRAQSESSEVLSPDNVEKIDDER